MPNTNSSSPENTLLRDRLALDRTRLANERTLLAYTRTALAFLVTGVSLLHFFDAPAAMFTGWALTILGASSFLVGVHNFFQMRRRLNDFSATLGLD